MNNTHIDDNELYHADTSRIGKSGLDLIAKSPAHYWAKYLDPNRVRDEPTAALQMGTAVHHAVLEPKEYARRYVVAPPINKRTNAGKEEYEQLIERLKANRQTLLTKEDYDTCLRMQEAVYQHPAASVLLERGEVERKLVWEHPENHVSCKIKPDFLSHTEFIVDLKTTEDASPEGFAKSVWNYRYDVQGAFYTDGYTARFGKSPKGFIFIAVEKSAPYAVGVYYLTPEIYEVGRKRYMHNLEVYRQCLQFNEWPAYGNEIRPLTLPGWAYKQVN